MLADLAPLDRSALPATSWRVEAFGAVSSTNDRIKELLRAGAPEGAVATALYQSGGYGRQGRQWESPVGGLYTSFALRPAVDMRTLPTLSLAASLAVCRAIESVAAPAGLAVKWPNDVLARAGKLSGISLEALAGGVCIGVGINVFSRRDVVEVPGKYRLASLFDDEVVDDLSAAQRAIATRLLGALLTWMDAYYRRWQDEGFAGLIGEYERRLAFVGSSCALETIDGTPLEAGTIRGVDAQWRLLVETPSGIVPAASGEVHVTSIG